MLWYFLINIKYSNEFETEIFKYRADGCIIFLPPLILIVCTKWQRKKNAIIVK